MGWNEQQEQAIYARNSSVIVSAAAGSGKTAVLTERLVKLIADPQSGVRADRIVVVTFTNDAASELKSRLDSKLRKLINEKGADPHLLRQQTLLQSAKISTINSFCFDLIRDNISDNGITSGFGVLDEMDSKVLKAQAMDRLLNYYSENDYEKISYLYDRFCIKDEKRLIEAITLTDNFLASVAMREKWLDTAVCEYEKEFTESIYYSRLISSVTEILEKAERTANENIAMISRVYADMSSKAAEKAFAQAVSDYDKISDYLSILRSGRLPDETENENLCSFDSFVLAGKAEHDKRLREVNKKKRERIKKLAAKAADSMRSVESDFRESGRTTKILAEVVRKYQEIIWEMKCEKNALSFDDGERLAIELLADTDENGRIIQSETAEKMADFYDIIMIDEYQDSNNKQDIIFKLLSKNYHLSDDGRPLYGDNVFLVGDVKQSIYSFRLANPKNFLDTLKSSEPYDENSNARNKAIFLNRNYRSTRNVIDFINYVFSEIMSEKTGGIEYDDNEKLYYGAEYYDGTDSRKCLSSINFIMEDASDDEEKTADKKVSREAVYTAQKIAGMLRNGEMVTENDGTSRPCRPSDFSILVRTNKFINIYAEQLTKLGIPVKGREESGYLKSREIAVLIDLLRIINNPLLDISMAAVMTSPMYMFAMNELAYIKSLDKERPIYSVMRELADGGFPECPDMFLRERCREMLDSLSSFRLDSVTMTIGELISSIYDTTDFISVMQLYSDGEKKKANLRALIQYAANYESSVSFEGSGGLNGFLRHLDRVMENGDYTQGKISAASGDYVSVQTIHSSKGLEFPFVFIAETSVEFRFDTEIVKCADDGEIGYILYDPKIYRKYRTFQQVILEEKEKNDIRSEEMRLFYVGLTRAKQKLFINLKCGEKTLKKVCGMTENCIVNNNSTEEIVSEAKCYADWIWTALMKHAEFPEIAEKLGIADDIIQFPKAEYDDVLFEWTAADNISELEFMLESETAEKNPDMKLCDELEDIINDDYDRSLSDMPAKLSVTQIITKLKKEDEIIDYRLKRPRFKSGEEKLTGAERGTAVHTFFQYCNFERAIADIKAEIADAAENGYITYAQAEAIDVDKASAFFESDLFRRIKAAGDKVWREKKFMVALSQLKIDNELFDVLKSSDGMIKGIADLMFEEDGEIVLVDYKSDRGISENRLREKYRAQLSLYKSAIELTMKKRVKQALLYSFELEKTIDAEI